MWEERYCLLFFKYIFSFQRYTSFKNMQIGQVITPYTQLNFDQILMKKDISANLYQKCLILCSKILLNVLHNMSLTDLLLWQPSRFQAPPISKAFLVTFATSIFNSRIAQAQHELSWVMGKCVARWAVNIMQMRNTRGLPLNCCPSLIKISCFKALN